MIGGTCGFFCGPYFQPWAGLHNAHSKMCVTQEFGTLAPHVVGSNLVEENFAWHHHLQVSGAATRYHFIPSLISPRITITTP